MAYCCRVHTLVTLGTPHKSAEPVTRRNIDFVNDNYGGAHMDDVRWGGAVHASSTRCLHYMYKHSNCQQHLCVFGFQGPCNQLIACKQPILATANAAAVLGDCAVVQVRVCCCNCVITACFLRVIPGSWHMSAQMCHRVLAAVLLYAASAELISCIYCCCSMQVCCRRQQDCAGQVLAQRHCAGLCIPVVQHLHRRRQRLGRWRDTPGVCIG
jgi:hypothetical protein